MNFFYYFFIFFLLFFVSLNAQDDFSDWSKDELKKANTAIKAEYLSIEEKNVFFILNLARINPKLFSETILKNYKGVKGFSNDFLKHKKYLNSLSKTLKDMNKLNPIYPNKVLWEYALCHATKSGKRGIVGHERRGCDSPEIYSECCSYGFHKGLDIVLQLLIDYKIKDLGHRKIMLDPKQKFLGVSIKAHKTYLYNAVLDFSYQL